MRALLAVLIIFAIVACAMGPIWFTLFLAWLGNWDVVKTFLIIGGIVLLAVAVLRAA